MMIGTGTRRLPLPGMRAGSWLPLRTPGLTQIDNLITTHWHGDHFGAEWLNLPGAFPSDFIDRSSNVPASFRSSDHFANGSIGDL